MTAVAISLSTAGVATAVVPPAPDFGPNVTIFDPSMPIADIQAKVDAVNAVQIDNEMGTERVALLFKPGTYGTAEQPLQMKVGYYTELAGLGAMPTDVVINGKIEVYNRCLENGGTSNCLALVNFWRTVSNLTLQVNGFGQDGCRASANFWAVSQASPMRRVNVTGGNLSLMDYCTAGPQYASGGFLADSQTQFIINGSQQQWITRNSTVGGWSNAVWNQVFAGVEGAPDDATFPDPPYTTLANNPLSREKPYLYIDGDGKYHVRVPSAQANSRGITWAGGMTPGVSIPISKFFIARPSDSVTKINKMLDSDKNVLFTPGVYDINKSIKIRGKNQVVLGMGLATLTSVKGAIPMIAYDVPGIIIAGITIDAGPVNSEMLLQVGKRNDTDSPDKRAKKSSPTNPTTLSDVFFRVGGPHIGKTNIALEVNSDNVLIDHTWVWRADHGDEGFPKDTVVRSEIDATRVADGLPLLNDDDTRWVTNTAANGAIINGDNVVATGLFVEHFQQYNLIWNGDGGKVVLYQNELPYDPRTQADWMNGAVEGYAGYKVGDGVTTHELWGAGVYVFNQNNPSVHTENGFEVPVTPGVKLHHIMTVNLSQGTIDHVVNGVGAAATNEPGHIGVPIFVTEYPAP